MHCSIWYARFICLALFLIVSPGFAHAQATRTWVSGVGDDANPCSRTAPCKTFAGAISKTAAGGEISVLDPGGFGAVTITKSISIVNYDSGEAGILASSTNGIVVNAAGAVVYLRGLVIDGAPPSAPGLNGIRFLAGAALYVDKCVIKNFTSAGGFGINFVPSTAAKLFVANTTLTNNGSGVNGGGIRVAATGASGINAVLDRVHINNSASGITLDGAGSTTALNLTVRDSVVAENAGMGISAVSLGGGAPVKAMVTNSTIAGNVGAGVNANGVNASGAGSALILIGGSTVSLNATGVSVTGAGAVRSFKNNQIGGNLSDGTPITAFPGPGGSPLQ